mmetsp:Transcript_9055/g.13521  ORF Transcript_9055/g.13521 Transcript_9055/m.13521 type:complete len:88 (-) Transcript_9055:1908-2171(-)
MLINAIARHVILASVRLLQPLRICTTKCACMDHAVTVGVLLLSAIVATKIIASTNANAKLAMKQAQLKYVKMPFTMASIQLCQLREN